MARTASAAAAVRKVISTTGNPPSAKASASGKAAAASSTPKTGTTPYRESWSKTESCAMPHHCRERSGWQK